jgi:hypothetical protein
MYTIADEYFFQTIELIRKEEHKKLPNIAIDAWLKMTYKINPINIIHEEKNQSLLIVLNEIDYNKIVVKDHNFNIVSKKIEKKTINWIKKNMEHNITPQFINFTDELRIYTIWESESEAKKIIQVKYSDIIWRIEASFYSVTIFYFINDDLNRYKDSSIELDIRKICYDCIKQRDEFNLYSVESFICNFDSKENVDKNYNGNLQFYFQSN